MYSSKEALLYVRKNIKGGKMTSTISINGVKITISQGNISIVGGKLIVDGNEVKIGDSKDVHIEGNVNDVKATGDVTITGDVKGSVDAGGSVSCRDVGDEIDAGGSVRCSKVGGDIDAGGSVHIK